MWWYEKSPAKAGQWLFIKHRSICTHRWRITFSGWGYRFSQFFTRCEKCRDEPEGSCNERDHKNKMDRIRHSSEHASIDESLRTRGWLKQLLDQARVQTCCAQVRCESGAQRGAHHADTQCPTHRTAELKHRSSGPEVASFDSSLHSDDKGRDG